MRLWSEDPDGRPLAIGEHATGGWGAPVDAAAANIGMRTMDTPLDPETVERIRQLGGEELLSELVGLFLVHTPERLKSLRAGVFENDLSRAEKAAHSFRSSSVTLGARSAAEQAGVLERMAHRGECEALREELPAFEATAAALMGFLSMRFGEHRE